jgi:hypothetical protein
MFGSYTSYTSGYGSYGTSMTSAIDINPGYLSSRSQDHSCAFPSWPRRSSLSESDATEMRATSYISDEDLQDVFEDDAHSVSSADSASQSPAQEQVMLEMQRAQENYQREMMRHAAFEKERRRQQAAMKQQRQRRGSSKKSPKNKASAMSPIAEAE